jgi:hypothetical protein
MCIIYWREIIIKLRVKNNYTRHAFYISLVPDANFRSSGFGRRQLHTDEFVAKCSCMWTGLRLLFISPFELGSHVSPVCVTIRVVFTHTLAQFLLTLWGRSTLYVCNITFPGVYSPTCPYNTVRRNIFCVSIWILFIISHFFLTTITRNSNPRFYKGYRNNYVRNTHPPTRVSTDHIQT